MIEFFSIWLSGYKERLRTTSGKAPSSAVYRPSFVTYTPPLSLGWHPHPMPPLIKQNNFSIGFKPFALPAVTNRQSKQKTADCGNAKGREANDEPMNTDRLEPAIQSALQHQAENTADRRVKQKLIQLILQKIKKMQENKHGKPS